MSVKTKTVGVNDGYWYDGYFRVYGAEGGLLSEGTYSLSLPV